MTQSRRILVLGGSGQLARALRDIAEADVTIFARGRPGIDITRTDSVAQALDEIAPQAVINAAAFTDVDGAEGQPDLAFAVNRDGAACAATLCADRAIRFIHVSSDYVFDGQKGSAYAETDIPAPLSVYGQSKLEGEHCVLAANPAALVVRSAWLVSRQGPCFITAIAKLARERTELMVVDDQRGCLTLADDLATCLVALTRTDNAGILHAAGPDSASWFDIAREIVGVLSGLDPGLSLAQIKPVSSKDYGARAIRPADSRLDCTRLYAITKNAFRPWRETVRACLAAA